MGQYGDKYIDRPYYTTWWFEWLVLLLCFAVGWLLWNQLDGLWAENANTSNQFIELARSMARGQGYTLPYAGSHVPYLNTPPLYPFLLSLIMLFFKTSQASALAGPFLALNMSLYGLSILLVYTFISNRIRRPYSFIITLLYTLSPMTLSAVKSMSPELLYLVLSLWAMVTIDKYFAKEPHRIKRNHVVWACVTVVLALLTMNLGFALLASFFALTLYKIGTKRAFITMAIVLLIMTPWFLREGFHRTFSQVVPARFEHALAKNPAIINPSKHPGHFSRQMVHNADLVMAEITQSTLGSLDFRYLTHPTIQKMGINRWEFHFSDSPWIRWLLSGITLLGIMLGLSQYSGIGSLYLLSLITLSLFFPLEDSLSSFPVMPLKLFCLYNGMLWIANSLKSLHFPLGRVAIPILTMFILLNSANDYFLTLSKGEASNLSLKNPIFNQKGLNPPVSEAAYLKAMRWLRANTPPTAHVVAENPRNVKLLSQRFTRPLQRSKAPSHVKRYMVQQTDYIVEEPNSPVSQAYLTPALEKYPQHFRLVYNDAHAQVRIWKVISAIK